MTQKDSYQALVTAFYQAILNPDNDSYIKDALALASSFDEDTVTQAKAEASVMSVLNTKFEA